MYDPSITARKARKAATETAFGAGAALSAIAMVLALAWWLLPLFGIAVPESVQRELTPERLVLVGGAVAASPVWAAIGRAARNWNTHRPRRQR